MAGFPLVPADARKASKLHGIIRSDSSYMNTYPKTDTACRAAGEKDWKSGLSKSRARKVASASKSDPSSCDPQVSC